MSPQPAAATEAQQILHNTKLDALIAALATSNGHLAAIVVTQGDLVTAQNASTDALVDLVSASEAQRIEVVGVAERVEQQRVDTLAATETTRIAQLEATHALPH